MMRGRRHPSGFHGIRSLALAGVLFVVGCGSDSDDEQPARLDATTRSLTVERGETVEVVIGEVNSSIGDAWQLGDVSPAGSVSIVEERYEDGDCPDGGAGCNDGTLIWELEVTGGGTITFDAENCYRGRCPGDEGAEQESETRTYTLTVTS
jgi:hypothetical protein